jgi:hypothetical protein
VYEGGIPLEYINSKKKKIEIARLKEGEKIGEQDQLQLLLPRERN